MPNPNTVVRNIQRPSPEQLEKLSRLGVATVHEAQGRIGLLAPYMRPIYPGAHIAGSAVTVLAQPGDNIMLHVAIELCRPGDVIVIALSADNNDGMLGELLATSYRAHGVQAVILDAGCRDTAFLRQMNFPVWAKCVSAKGTVKATGGSVNTPVVCAGAYIEPGDAIVADDDGVVVVRRAHIDEVIQLSIDRDQREEKLRARLATGELSLDILGLRGKLADMGIVYVDGQDDA